MARKENSKPQESVAEIQEKKKEDVVVGEKPKRGRPKKEKVVAGNEKAASTVPAVVEDAPEKRLVDVSGMDEKYVKYLLPDESGNYITPINYQWELKTYTEHLKALMCNVNMESLKIGVLLNAFKDNFQGGPHLSSWSGEYENIYDYAQKEIGLSRGSAFNFMSVAKRFTENQIRSDDGQVHVFKDYENFSMSQLIQFLPYENADIIMVIAKKNITPDMSVRDIKNKLKDLLGKKKEAALPAPDMDSCLKIVDDVIEGRLASDASDNITEEKKATLDSVQAATSPFDGQAAIDDHVYSAAPLPADGCVYTYEPKGGIFPKGVNASTYDAFRDIVLLYLGQGYKVKIVVEK